MFVYFLRMPRNRERRTDRGTSQEVMEAAASAVIDNKSVRSVAKEFGICPVSLYRFYKKIRDNLSPKTGYNPHNRVFKAHEEEMLTNYVKRTADLYYMGSPAKISGGLPISAPFIII